MQLSDLRQEVLAHGFDPVYFNSNRLNTYINKGYMLICRRVDYYADEAVFPFQTAAGIAIYSLPPDFARLRAVEDTDRELALETVALRDIDNSVVAQGTPSYYAMDGANVHFYPTPDGLHNMQFRYWNLPVLLAGDSDTPNLPPDWHDLLWIYACWLCFEAEDDQGQAQAWQQRFLNGLSMFKADQQFINSDEPNQVRGMWDSSPSLSPTGGWTAYGGF